MLNKILRANKRGEVVERCRPGSEKKGIKGPEEINV